MGTNSRSRSMLFLMEQLIVILIFAICAAVCVRIFFASYTIANAGNETNQALLIAENGAECYKAAGGDGAEAAALLSGSVEGEDISVYYDAAWNPCQADAAMYRLVLSEAQENPDPALRLGNLTVMKITGEELISFPVAARGDAG